MYIYISYIIYGKEIKLSFRILRVSCKHSSTFFSLIILIYFSAKNLFDFLIYTLAPQKFVRLVLISPIN